MEDPCRWVAGKKQRRTGHLRGDCTEFDLTTGCSPGGDIDHRETGDAEFNAGWERMGTPGGLRGLGPMAKWKGPEPSAWKPGR